MTNTLKTHIGNWLLIIAAFALFCLFAFGLSGCKSRKIQKDVSKSVDKTEIGSTVREIIIVQDTDNYKSNINVKESAESNKTFDTEQTTTINYDTLGRVKNAVIVKKSKGQSLSKSDKTDKSTMDFVLNHSEIKRLDSSSVIKADKSDTVKNRESESKKDNTVIWIAFFVCVTFGLIWWLKY